MRRVQIDLDEYLDEAPHVEAARTGRSKASLVRECLAKRYARSARLVADPLDRLIGPFDVDLAVDAVIYGPAGGSRRPNRNPRGETKVHGEMP